jgi:stage II sporulation protein GA (sporulation sigma-E factor processing peptidase)
MMVQEVYIDLYILVNVSMDLLCLLTVAALLHQRTRRWRAVLASILGGLYAAAALLLGLEGFWGLLGDAVAAFAMCVITFGVRRRSVWHAIRPIPILMLVSMTLGGIMTALYAALNRLRLPFEALEGDGLSVWTFALLTAVASFATLRGGRLFGFSHKTRSVTVSATLLGRDVTFCALVDSGNFLRDPLSGKSVIVVDAEKLRGVLPQNLLDACKSGTVSSFLATFDGARLCRLIPTKTASGEGFLLALLPDKLTVSDGKSTLPADYLIAPAPLGSAAEGFDAVIGTD